jgi:hypothetical protein
MRQETRLEMERVYATRPRKVVAGVTRGGQLTLVRISQLTLRWPLRAIDPCKSAGPTAQKGS